MASLDEHVNWIFRNLKRAGAPTVSKEVDQLRRQNAITKAFYNRFAEDPIMQDPEIMKIVADLSEKDDVKQLWYNQDREGSERSARHKKIERYASLTQAGLAMGLVFAPVYFAPITLPGILLCGGIKMAAGIYQDVKSARKYEEYSGLPLDIAKTVIKESVQIALQIVPFLPVTVPTSLYGVVNSYLPHYSRASRSAALNHMYNGKDGLRDILQQRARSAAEQMQRQRQAAAQRQQYQRQAA